MVVGRQVRVVAVYPARAGDDPGYAVADQVRNPTCAHEAAHPLRRLRGRRRDAAAAAAAGGVLVFDPRSPDVRWRAAEELAVALLSHLELPDHRVAVRSGDGASRRVRGEHRPVRVAVESEQWVLARQCRVPQHSGVDGAAAVGVEPRLDDGALVVL